MSDILAAMREFRSLDDKRRNNGLQGNEEERWNVLRGVLKGDRPPAQEAPPPAPSPPAATPEPAAATPAPADEPAAEPAPRALESAPPAAAAPPPAHVELAAAFLAAAPAEPEETFELLEVLETPDPAAAEPEAAAAAQPADANGYMWHAESGLFWHAGAQHWYEPQSGTYYDVNGDAVPREIAQANAAGALQAGAAPAPAVDLAEPADVALDLAIEASPAAEAVAAAEAAAAAEQALAIEPAQASAPAFDTLPAGEEDTELSFALDGDPEEPMELASGADLLHLAAEAAGVDDDRPALELDAHTEEPLELAAPAAFLDQAAAPHGTPPADPWAGVLGGAPELSPGPSGGGWEFVVAPVTPGPANPSVDLWASASNPLEQPVQRPEPSLLPFDTSRVPEPASPRIEAEIEAGFDGWGERSEGPSTGPAPQAGVVLPWDPPEGEQEVDATDLDENDDFAAPASLPEPALVEAAEPLADDEASFLAAPHEFLDVAGQESGPAPDGFADQEDDFLPGATLSMDGAVIAAAEPGVIENDDFATPWSEPEPEADPGEDDGAAILLDDDLVDIVPPWSPPLPSLQQPAASPAAPLPIARVGVTSLGARGLVTGEHRAVIHTREGVVKRGLITNVDLAGRSIGLRDVGGKREEIATASLKAVFLMRGPDSPAIHPEGSAVRITFSDGRPLQGWASDLADPVGFFLIPSDAKGLASRVFVYRSAIREISVD